MNKLGSIFEEIPADKLDFPLAAADRRETIFRQHRIGEITQQGDQPHCVGHSVAALLAADPVRQKPFTPEEIYKAARKIDNTPRDLEGAKLTSAIQFLKNQGVIKQDFWTAKPEVAVQYIFTTSPIVLSIPWFSRMDEPKDDGRCIPKGSIYGFHAVLGYSYDALKERIWLQNSWGENFGRAGCFYLTFKDFQAIMAKGGIAASVIE